MDINSINLLLNSTTFPIAITIVLLLGGYKLFNKSIVPLINSCIESNKEFVIALEKINSGMSDMRKDVDDIKDDIKEIKNKIN